MAIGSAEERGFRAPSTLPGLPSHFDEPSPVKADLSPDHVTPPPVSAEEKAKQEAETDRYIKAREEEMRRFYAQGAADEKRIKKETRSVIALMVGLPTVAFLGWFVYFLTKDRSKTIP
jgi:hypothetical protein